MRLPDDFMIGAATAAHQVEGNNINSDFWTMEQMQNSGFDEPSLEAVDHYNRYKEDITLMAEAGLNAYRFSIEWARIEPEKGCYDQKEVAHYREVLEFCHAKDIEPIVTMHHFSSPKWLIMEGGWEHEGTVHAFAEYCGHVVRELGDLLSYVCTINEANMGLQIAALVKSYMRQMQSDIQVGINLEASNPLAERMKVQAAENLSLFGVEKLETFLSVRSEEGDLLIMRAHEAARKRMKAIKPSLKVGVTLSLHDFQPLEGCEALAAKEWDEEFGHYMPYILEDDFLGVQNYTRQIIGPNGVEPIPQGSERTQMDYEVYPKAISNVIRKVADEVAIPIIVTENGIATSDDRQRINFIEEAVAGVASCVKEGIPVLGYFYWSLLDNFEWQKGYTKTFGLISVDRSNQKRLAKESLYVLGRISHTHNENN